MTYNLRDFPDISLAPYGLCAVHPDDFIVAQFDLDEVAALSAMKRMRLRTAKPPMDSETFIGAFRRNQLLQTADRLVAAADLI